MFCNSSYCYIGIKPSKRKLSFNFRRRVKFINQTPGVPLVPLNKTIVVLLLGFRIELCLIKYTLYSLGIKTRYLENHSNIAVKVDSKVKIVEAQMESDWI